jgi:SPP1 gp7 family putative phage head morphogenesis protein
MSTANERLRDRIIQHQIELQRFSTGTRNQVIDLLDETEADIRDALEKGYSPGMSEARLQYLEDVIRNIREPAMQSRVSELSDLMRQFIRHEADFNIDAIEEEVPVTLDLATPDPKTLESLVDESRFLGKSLKEWGGSMSEAELDRINTQVRTGMVQGQGVDDVVRGVLGSKEFNGADGVTSTTRSQVDSLVRTAINQYSNTARQAIINENKDVVDEEVYVATLDSRTTVQCASNDGKHFPVGEGPKPPLHFRCRSTRVPVIGGKLIGDRPLKPDSERDMLKRYSDKEGIDQVKSRDALPKGHKGSYDEFKRAEVRKLTGQTPAPTTYDEFLRRQSKEFQEDVLGVQKAELFRNGMTLDKFVDHNGKPYTLDQLKAKEAKASTKGEEKRRQKAKDKASEGVKAHARDFPWDPIEPQKPARLDYGNRAFEDGIEHGLWKTRAEADNFIGKMMAGVPKGEKVDVRVMAQDGALHVSAFNKSGSVQVMRSFHPDADVVIGGERFGTKVQHDLFTLAKQYQGGGNAKRMMRASLEEYLKAGITKIDVHANIDVGGYAWAKLGFTPKYPDVTRSILRDLLDGRGSRLAPVDRLSLRNIIDNTSPSDLMHKIATFKTAAGKSVGKELLTDSDWHGTLDLTNPAAVKRLKEMLA